VQSRFETLLERDGEHASIAIDGPQVSVTIGREPADQRTYAYAEDAAFVFEANVDALHEEGFVEVEQRNADEAPGALADWNDDRDEFFWICWRDGQVDTASVYAADPVGTGMATRGLLRDAPPHGRFDNAKLNDVWGLGHALRRLLHHPRSSRMTSFELAIAFEHDRLLDQVANSQRRQLLSHLMLIQAWRDNPLCRPRALADEFPNLRSLTLHNWSVPHFMQRPLEHLQVLSLSRYSAEVNRKPPPTRPVSELLSDVARAAPNLQALVFPDASLDSDQLRQLLVHPLLQRITTLDILATSYIPDLDLLLAHRDELGHLENLFVTDHGLSSEDRARLDEWPAVCRVDHNKNAPRFLAFWDHVGP